MSTSPAPGGAGALRVLVVDLSIRYGGASTRALAIAGALASWGAMIAGIDGSPVIRAAQDRGIAFQVVGRSRFDPAIPFRLAEVIRKHHIQVVDTQNIQSKVWVSLAALLGDFAFVSTLNSFYRQEHGDSWKSRLYHSLDYMTNWRTSRYIAVSETIRNGLLGEGIPAERIDLIRNAVDLPPETPSVNLKDIRRDIGIPPDALLCVLLGRFVWAKGFDDFVSAFAKVAAQVDNAFAVIVGQGELRDKVAAQIDSLGLSDRILLPGYLPHAAVMNILAASDLYVMSSRTEGIPFALLEAAAFGLPIVSTRCGGVPEVVTDGESALLVPIGDVSALGDTMLALLTNPPQAQRLGKNARAVIAKNYALTVQIEITKTSYLRAAQDHQRAVRNG